MVQPWFGCIQIVHLLTGILAFPALCTNLSTLQNFVYHLLGEVWACLWGQRFPCLPRNPYPERQVLGMVPASMQAAGQDVDTGRGSGAPE